MIDTTNCDIIQMAVHHVGNKANEEEVYLSQSNLDISDDVLRDRLIKYFLSPFEEQETYHFTSEYDDYKENLLYRITTEMFEDSSSFHQNSIEIANHLFACSTHPKTKAGALFVAEFSEMRLNGKLMKVIGLFKAENLHPFLKVNQASGDFVLNYDDGILVDKLDKGALIFYTALDEGYKIAIIDKSNRLTEAQYWKEAFLKLKPCDDEYHHTKEFLKVTKDYITNQMVDEFDVERADQIDMLNRSMSYFKNHEAFNKDEFESQVFYDQGVIDSFRDYHDNYCAEHEIMMDPEFEISPVAVKKQERIFKSILKLDKNFHIYIHGDRSKIERGTEHDGRKFYKIYFESER